MRTFSTVEVAEKLGMRQPNLQRLIAKRQIPFPPLAKVGRVVVRLWSNADMAKVRKVLKARGKEKNDARQKR